MEVQEQKTSPTRTVVPEEVADTRLWRARDGTPGMYVVDRDEKDSVFFEIQCYYRRADNRRIIKVIPVSNWVDGKCMSRAREVQKGEWPPFLPSCVLFGKLDYNRLPEKHFDELADWADIVLDAVDRYDRLNPRRQSNNRRRDN